MIATSAMKPRPAVIPCTHWVTSESASWPPARPHSTPHSVQAANFIRTGSMPAPSAASGSSPTARSRTPNGWRKNSHHVAGTSSAPR